MRNSKRESDTGIPVPLAGWNEEDNEPSVKVPNTWHATMTRERETMDAFQSKHINCTHSHTAANTHTVHNKEFSKEKEKEGMRNWAPTPFDQ